MFVFCVVVRIFISLEFMIDPNLESGIRDIYITKRLVVVTSFNRMIMHKYFFGEHPEMPWKDETRVFRGKVKSRKTFHTTVVGDGVLTLTKDNCMNRLSLQEGQSVFLMFNKDIKKWVIQDERA